MRCFALVFLFGLVATATAQASNTLGGKRTRNFATIGKEPLVKAQVFNVKASVLGGAPGSSFSPKFIKPRRDSLIKIGNVAPGSSSSSNDVVRASARPNIRAAVKLLNNKRNSRDFRRTQPNIHLLPMENTPELARVNVAGLEAVVLGDSNDAGDAAVVNISDNNVDEIPDEETAEKPSEGTPIEEAPVEEKATEEAAIEEAAIEDPAIEEAAIEEPAIKEEPIKEEPIKEEPIEEAPVKETPPETPGCGGRGKGRRGRGRHGRGRHGRRYHGRRDYYGRSRGRSGRGRHY